MKSIWQEDNDYYKPEPLLNAMVASAEEKLNVKLPNSYIKILKQQNGGCIKYDAYPSTVPTSWADDHVHINHNLGIGEKNSILESEYLIQEWELPRNIVLLSGDGHSWIALDYRKTNENPQVIYIDCEANQQVKLANSFDEFLQGLYVAAEIVEENGEVYVEREWTQEEVEIALSSNDNEKIIRAFNYLYANPNINDYSPVVEHGLLDLLQHADEKIKMIAATYATHFNEKKQLSSEFVGKMIAILRSDVELEGYLPMF